MRRCRRARRSAAAPMHKRRKTILADRPSGPPLTARARPCPLNGLRAARLQEATS